jgi:hypothetical protein
LLKVVSLYQCRLTTYITIGMLVKLLASPLGFREGTVALRNGLYRDLEVDGPGELQRVQWLAPARRVQSLVMSLASESAHSNRAR